MISKLIKILLLFISFSVYAQSNLFFEQVLTEKEIKAKGIFSIADLLNFLDGWSYENIDGTFSNPLNRFNFSSPEKIKIYLNDQLIELSSLDHFSLNLLPISLDQIDSVIYSSIPSMFKGEYSSTGVIRFYTKKVPEGFTIRGVHSAVNETGDPGPYKFTTYETDNVDKLNFDLSGGIDAGGKNWYLSANYKSNENFVTDPKLERRVGRLSIGDKKSRLNSSSLLLGFDYKIGKSNFYFGSSEYADFYFFDPYQNEIPSMRNYLQSGISGSLSFSKIISLEYDFSFTKNELGFRENWSYLNFDWKHEKYYARLNGVMRQNLYELTVGLIYEQNVPSTTEILNINHIVFGKFFASLLLKPTSKLIQNFDLQLTKYKNDSGIRVGLQNLYKVDRWNSIGLNFSYSEKFYRELLDYWTWYKEGYSSNVTNLVTQSDYDLGKSSTLDFAFYYDWNFKQIVNLRLSAFYSELQNQLVELESIRYIPEQFTLEKVTDFRGNEFLCSAGVNSEIKLKISDWFSTKVYYQFQTDVSGTNLLSEKWMRLPEHTAALELMFNVAESFSTWTRFKYYSSTTWLEYRYVEQQSNSLYNYKLKEKFLLELSLSKWFWDRKVWANVVFRNLLNQEESYHPVGADLDLRFLFQIHLYFNSLFE